MWFNVKTTRRISFPFVAVFERYQKERSNFVQKVAELANHSENIETLQNGGENYSNAQAFHIV